MPRTPRLVLPGFPYHVTQRGVDRRHIFVDDEDRQHYCRLLLKASAKHGVAVHAYALMPNHVHLLLTPEHADSLARTMKCCGHAYVQAFNRRHGRCGALMQGRYFSSAIGSDRHLLEVLRYIELNPVRACLVPDPVDYPWSSARCHLGLGRDVLLRSHETYVSLGPTSEARVRAYSDWLAAGIERDRLAAIRTHLRQGRVFGPVEFQESLARRLGRATAVRRPGRPTKAPKESACVDEPTQAVRESLLTGNVPV